jgi:hypothetical protein
MAVVGGHNGSAGTVRPSYNRMLVLKPFHLSQNAWPQEQWHFNLSGRKNQVFVALHL